MSGNNMESLLMGGDDSSSGESDDEEVNVPTGTATTAASAVTVTAPPPAAAAPPPVSVSVPPPTQSPAKPIPVAAPIAAPAAPAPAPVIAPPVPAPAAAPPAKSSQADQMARLKSLYSISKSTASSNANTNTNSGTGSSSGPGTPSTPTAPKISQPPPQQQQAPQQQRQQQTTTQHAPTQYQNPQHKPQVYQQSQPPQQSNQRQQQPPQSRQPQQPPPQQEMHPPSRLQPQQRPQQPQQQPQQYSQSSSQRTQYSQQQKQQPQPQQTHHQRPSSSQPAQQHQQQQQMQHRQQVHRRGNVQHSSRSTSSQPQQLHQAAAVVDPFAPTPLSQIKQSNQHRSRTHHQQQQPGLHQQPTQPSPRMPQQVVGGSSSSGGNSSRERDIKKQKEKFLMFTRVLIKYLEQKDKRMHHQAKIIIKDCAERNKRQEPGYESVTESMKRRLKELVGDHYWKKANDYLIHFIEQKRRQHAAAAAGGSSSGGGSRSSGSSSSAQQQQQQQLDAHKRRRLKEQEDRERLRLQSLEKERLKKDQASKQRTAVASPLVAIQQEIQEKREQITMQTAKVPTSSKASKSKSAARSTAAAIAANTTAATKGKGGGTKKAPRRKSAGESSTVTARRGSAAGSKTAAAASATVAAAPVKRVVVEEPPREYKELMELIDHAVDYDWPSVGQLLGAKSDLKLTEEEHLLLYGDLPEPSAKTKKRTSISKTSGKTPQGQDISVKIEGQVDKKVNREVRPGWGRSNVLSARSAWARVRLRELKIRKRAASNPSPIVAGGLLSLSTSVARDQQLSTSAAAIPIVDAATSATSTTKPEIEGCWVNEETAEQDAALSLLSAGCQIYLKGVLQKTIQCARQRQNLDGIRLWHQQYTFSKGTSTTSSNINSTALNLSKDDKSKKPPLSLRLGCDVSRQVAQAQGNAAMTVKRMEEALERQTGIPMRARELNNDTLQEATSMGDLSWRPLLKEGAEKAKYQAKRSFEVFGGKEAKDPPLGRVPKKAKLQVEDLLMGSELSIGGPYHKAYTASSFISF